MAQFEYGKVLDSLMAPDIVSALGNVREHRGRQELYKSLQLALLASGGKGEDILRAYFAGLVGTATKRKILGDNPTLSRRTVERVLQKLQTESIIEKVGAARATAYRRAER